LSQKQRRHRGKADDTFLPQRGQGAEDEGADWIVGCIVVLLEGACGLVMAIARPLWDLVRFVCWDAWRTEPKRKP